MEHALKVTLFKIGREMPWISRFSKSFYTEKDSGWIEDKLMKSGLISLLVLLVPLFHCSTVPHTSFISFFTTLPLSSTILIRRGTNSRVRNYFVIFIKMFFKHFLKAFNDVILSVLLFIIWHFDWQQYGLKTWMSSPFFSLWTFFILTVVSLYLSYLKIYATETMGKLSELKSTVGIRALMKDQMKLPRQSNLILEYSLHIVVIK